MSQIPPLDVAAEVRAALGRANVKPSHLAESIGMHRYTLSRRLNGTSDFTVSELTAIAHELDVDLASLIPPALAEERAS
jgi:transcriptional regulator with XRE-family HTH domain